MGGTVRENKGHRHGRETHREREGRRQRQDEGVRERETDRNTDLL